MNKIIKISIITVSYNAVKTINQTIKSVMDQTYTNIEYIIIDGGSSDGTIEIIKNYADRLTYWVSETDNGIYDAMNKGLKKASGDFVYFIGADDCLIDDDIIRKVVDILKKNDEVDILSGTVWMVDEKTKLQRLWQNNVSKEKIMQGYMVHHQGLFTKRKILEKYPFNLKYKIVSDYEFVLNTYFDKTIKYKYVATPIAFYSLGGISGYDASRLVEHVEVMEKFNLDKNIINQYKKLIKQRMDIRRFLKEQGKRIFCFMHIWIFLQKCRGWSAHKCEKSKCRWCGRK